MGDSSYCDAIARTTTSTTENQPERNPWKVIFNYTPSHTEIAISAHLADPLFEVISDKQWKRISEDLEAQGHNRESFAHYLWRSDTTVSMYMEQMRWKKVQQEEEKRKSDRGAMCVVPFWLMG